jgi:predicted dehydrogenase
MAKGLKVGVGLMSRHHRPLQELYKRVQDGEIGDVMFMRGYREHGPVASMRSERWPGEPSELLWQISRFHSFLWASGGCYNDFYIHHIDHLCWMKNGWPIQAQGVGGRHYRENYVDQNFDNYSVEYTFADGAKLYMNGRCITGCHDVYSSFVHGTKGMGIAAKTGDFNGPSSTYSGQNATRKARLWESKDIPGETDPYLNEWNDLITAIRANKPYNEVQHGVDASVTSSMGRMAAHTGQLITFEDFMAGKHEYAPDCDKWTMDSPPPLKSDANGRYPVPQPGRVTEREY